MSVIQESAPELRYLKRTNLEEEARVIGNYYRDIIRSYGICCKYYKLDTSIFENFKNIADQNSILINAYGYNTSPDYSVSAEMLAYMEVENDVFQLNRLGLIPEMNVIFYFDSQDFALALASKLGQYKELKIDEKEIIKELPDFPGLCYPFRIGGDQYTCGNLSGTFVADIEGIEYDKEIIISCLPKWQTDLEVVYPANADLYTSMKRTQVGKSPLETKLFLTYHIERVLISNKSCPKYKNILHGKLYGSVLFYDFSKLGKYKSIIHPEVGDIVSIDFPDENNREQYEITETLDKQLTTDGISPLLHKYIWKCRAKRYVNADEAMEDNEANNEMDERIKHQIRIKDEIDKKIEVYPNNEDKIYGGYSDPQPEYDKENADLKSDETIDISLDSPETWITILDFDCGSRLATTGYDLIFINVKKEPMKLTIADLSPDLNVQAYKVEKNLRFLKSTKDCLVFVNLEGKAFRLAETSEISKQDLEICLNSFFESTLDPEKDKPKNGNFYIFKESKTFLFATEKHLYCKLEDEKDVKKLI